MLVTTKIYDSLQDDVSRNLFKNRLLFNYTGDVEYHNNILSEIGIEIACKDLAIPNDVVIYGAGMCGASAKTILGMVGVDVTAFCDSDITRHGTLYMGRTVISQDRLIENYADYTIVVAVANIQSKSEIMNILLSLGFTESQIIDYYVLRSDMVDPYIRTESISANIQYFDNSVIPFCGNEEIFVDAGSYDFTNSLQFANWCGGSYEKIIALEPDPERHPICSENAKRMTNTTVYPFALWHVNTKLRFSNNVTVGTAKVVEKMEGTIEVEARKLDDVLHGQGASFIKMDIEGAELNALKGAENTIVKFKPKLAICVYHRFEDIIAIPEYILSLRDDYKLYLRHYSYGLNETVLYAL